MVKAHAMPGGAAEKVHVSAKLSTRMCTEVQHGCMYCSGNLGLDTMSQERLVSGQHRSRIPSGTRPR